MPRKLSASDILVPEPLRASDLESLPKDRQALVQEAYQIGIRGERRFRWRGRKASEELRRAIELFSKAGVDFLSAHTRYQLGERARRLKRFEESIRELETARHLYFLCGDPLAALACSLALAETCVQAANFPQFQAVSEQLLEDMLIIAPERVPRVMRLYVDFTFATLIHPDTRASIWPLLQAMRAVDTYADAIIRAASGPFQEYVRSDVAMVLHTAQKILNTVRYSDRGCELADAGQLEEAAAAFTQSLEFADSAIVKPRAFMAGVLDNRGLCYCNLGRLDDALKDYNLALHWSSRSPRLFRGRGLVYAKQGKDRAALRDFHKAMKYSKETDVRAKVNAASCLLSLKQLPKALCQVDAAIAAEPGNVMAHVLRGNILSEQNRDWEALDSYGRALDLDATNTQARERRMLLHAQNKRWIAVGKDLSNLVHREAPELGNFSPALVIDMLRFALYDCFKINPQSQLMGQFAETLLHLAPKDHQAHGWLGMYRLMHGQIHDAIAAFTRAIECGGELYQNYFHRGQAYDLAGDLTHAERDFVLAQRLCKSEGELQSVSVQLETIRGKMNGASSSS